MQQQYRLAGKLKIKDNHDGKGKDSDYGANNPFVPTHPACHFCQDPFALANVSIHPMDLSKRKKQT